MKYTNYAVYAIVGIAIIATVYTLVNIGFNYSETIGSNSSGEKIAETPKETQIQVTDPSDLETKSTGDTDTGNVSVDLKPYTQEEGKLKVDISVNTHSVDLSGFDLKKITTLEFDGKIINPVSAPSLGGHHSSGTMVFEVDKQLDKFTIKIKGIPKVEERVFEWS